MGSTCKGLRPHIRRTTVALKVIRKEVIDDDQSATLIARFKNVRRRPPAVLTHPGIVAVYEYGEDESGRLHRHGIRPGQGAARVLSARHALGLGDVVSIMTQLLDGLGYAHETGCDTPRHQAREYNHHGSSSKLKVAAVGIAHPDFRASRRASARS